MLITLTRNTFSVLVCAFALSAHLHVTIIHPLGFHEKWALCWEIHAPELNAVSSLQVALATATAAPLCHPGEPQSPSCLIRGAAPGPVVSLSPSGLPGCRAGNWKVRNSPHIPVQFPGSCSSWVLSLTGAAVLNLGVKFLARLLPSLKWQQKCYGIVHCVYTWMWW